MQAGAAPPARGRRRARRDPGRALNVVAPSTGHRGRGRRRRCGALYWQCPLRAAAGDYFANGPPRRHSCISGASRSKSSSTSSGRPASCSRRAAGSRPTRRCLLASCLALVRANLVVTTRPPTGRSTRCPTRAWQLGLGGLLAVGSHRRSRRIPGPIVGLAAGSASAASPGGRHLRLEPGLSGDGGAPAERGSDGPARRWLATVRSRAPALDPADAVPGRISYSLYLVHWPIFVLAPVMIGAELDGVTMVGLVGLSVAVAYVSWALVETPFRNGRPWFAIRPARTLSLGFAAVLAVVVVATGPSLGVPPISTVAAGAPAPGARSDAVVERWVDESPSATAASPARPARRRSPPSRRRQEPRLRVRPRRSPRPGPTS